jgi:hypothetical protein
MTHGFRSAVLAGALAAAALTTASAPGMAQDRRSDDSFRWTGPAASGAWVNIRNLNGNVRVESGAGSQVEVRATKNWRRGNPEDVQVRVTRYGPGDRDILVCALWGNNTTCTEDEYRVRSDDRSGRRNDNNDINVQFVITLPRGVHVEAATINGSIDVTGATGEINVNSVNGNVRAESSGGPVLAKAVNGNVTARMGRISTTEDITYSTVNGNVLVEFSDELNAEIEMSTVNGGFETNFPLTVRGRINPKHIRATVGNGGSRVKLSTVNGSVELRKN